MKRAESLLEVVPDVEVFAAAVEHHLDQHPLPVDEEEVARIAVRLQARIRNSSGEEQASARWTGARWFLLAGAALVAAAVWMSVRVSIEQSQGLEVASQNQILRSVVVDQPTVVRRVDTPGKIVFEGPSRSLFLSKDSVALTADDAEVAVVLVQEGMAESDQIPIPEGHWAVLGRAGGEAQTLIFADGEAPSGLADPVWAQTSAAAQLRELRWQSLPDRTHRALDRLLEE